MRVGPILAELLADGIVAAGDVAGVAGVTVEVVESWQGGDAPGDAATERLLELGAVLDAVRDVMDAAEARRWLHEPNLRLGHNVPLDLVRRGWYRRVIAVALEV